MEECIHIDDEVELAVEGTRRRLRLTDRAGDPTHGSLSVATPIGRAILGRQPGEELEVNVNGQPRRVRILSVQYAPRYEVLVV